MSLYVQITPFELGNPGSATAAYTSLQTAGNTNVIFLNQINGIPSGAGAGTISDTDGNSYSNPIYLGADTTTIAGECSGLWMFVATNITGLNSGGGGRNVVTLSIGGGGNYMDCCLMEYPATTGVRVSGSAFNSSLSSGVLPAVTLAGTTVNDTVIAVGTSGGSGGGGALKFWSLSGGSVGSNGATLTSGDNGTGSGGFDNWGSEEGSSSGGSISVTFGVATQVYWSMIALALKASGGPPQTDVVFASTNS